MNRETHIVVCSLRGMDIIHPRILWTKFSASVDGLGGLRARYKKHINDLSTVNILSCCISHVDSSYQEYDSDVFIVETYDDELYMFIDLPCEAPEEFKFKPGVLIHMGQHFNRYIEEFQHELDINRAKYSQD